MDTMLKTIDYPFSEADALSAYDEWGANCGPNALAFALRVPLESVRYAIPDFDAKRYTSPTMMAQGIAAMGRTFTPYAFPRVVAAMFSPAPVLSLVRIQWTGPWTAEGANPKWAYRQTHWVTAWKELEVPTIFDVNGGVMDFEVWKAEVVPALTAQTKRADGGWFPTHVWRVAGAAP